MAAGERTGRVAAKIGYGLADVGWERLEDVAEDVMSIRARLGNEPILLFETTGGLRGVQSHCPHAGYSLAQAQVVDGDSVRCYFHGCTFRLSDGRGTTCDRYRVAVYDVKEEAGALFVRRTDGFEAAGGQ